TLVDLQMQGVNITKIRGGKQGQQRVAEAVAMESANRLLTRRTLERLKAIATGEYKPEAASEAMKADEAEKVEDESEAVKGELAKTAKKKEAKSSAKSAGKSAKSGASKKTVTKKTAGKSSAKKSTSKK
ncbi:MAG TPA: hypothetical protein VIN60_02235, partial [Anaerolineales bacterium]